MKEIDKFINFLFKNIEDERVSLSKEIKYGYRFYHLRLVIEKDDPNSTYKYYNELSITIDNRNQCINLYNSYLDDKQTTIEDKDLIEKWNQKFEEYLSNNLERDVKNVIHNTMKDLKDKDLYRDYQMEKIFKDDESI
jgi:hypothetical protein